MTATDRSVRSRLVLLACLVTASGTGCTSVISSAYLRDAFWESTEHAAQPEDEPDSDDPIDEAALAAADEDRRAAAIEEAVSRLSRLGALDDATRTTLIETLQRTAQEDWPVVVDAFAESLGQSGQPSAGTAVTAALTPEPHIVAKADLDAAIAGERPAADLVSAETDLPDDAPETDVDPAADPEDRPAPINEVSRPVQVTEPVASGPDESPTVTEVAAVAPVPSEPPRPPDPPGSPLEPAEKPRAELGIHNACFATRVQAWGVVDRFPADEFQPGQDVIVYFELDSLTAGESPAGHTTCIDTALRLMAPDGTTLQDWSFEPIAETCRARRHDYFARYVVRIPDQAAGECQLAIAVTDTLSGAVAEAMLPLAIAAPAR
jgi:hypothetical protein